MVVHIWDSMNTLPCPEVAGWCAALPPLVGDGCIEGSEVELGSSASQSFQFPFLYLNPVRNIKHVPARTTELLGVTIRLQHAAR
jgi:hypothetical protein